MRDSFASRLLLLLGTCAWLTPRPAIARTFTLDDLLELAKNRNPGVAASREQTRAVEAQLLEARRHFLPSGEIISLVAPVPEIRCQTDLGAPLGADPKIWRQEHCHRTNISEASINLRGVFTRTELKLVQPLYTFGKVSAGVSAARAGIAASRGRTAGVVEDLALNVKKAYWGAKLAREALEALEEGKGRIDEGLKTVNKALEEQTGSVTLVDRYRLTSAAAEADIRILEARKGAALAKSGLRALIGPEAPADIEVDDEPLEPVEIAPRTIDQYQDQALMSRPEVRALDHLLESKRGLVLVEQRKLLPDVVLMGTATFAYASSIDNPKNAFFNDPFNTASAGLAAGVRWPLDLGIKSARVKRLQAEAEETFHRRREALGGIAFEVRKAHQELVEAQQRLEALRRGEKSGRAWINTVAQNFAAGLAETKDFADALLNYYQFRIRALEAIYDVNIAAATLSRAIGSEITR